MCDLYPVWEPDPSTAASSALVEFTRRVEHVHHLRLPSYRDLWRWSVQHVEQFWAEVWNFYSVNQTHVAEDSVLSARNMPGAKWFPAAHVNFTERVFTDRVLTANAVVAATENGRTQTLTWRELQDQVAALTATLRDLGVKTGDRVVGYLPNCAAAVVAFLATASLGAIWSCCAPDYAAAPAARRLGQLEPTVLVCADGYWFGGRAQDRRFDATALADRLPGLTAVLYVDHLGLTPPNFTAPVLDWTAALRRSAGAELNARAVPFDHPLWVLFSSGTTGVPKALVHGHGGVILEGLKSLGLHLDLTSHDRLFWYTTTNWMMWNITVEALLLGASVVLYDGSPTHPTPERLWQLAADHKVTVLGVSPGYLSASDNAGARPATQYGLEDLRQLGVTGAPVPASAYHWLHREFDGRVPLVSMSGGTDVVSALATGAPTLPIRAGEIAAPALGVALDAFDINGQSVRGEVGELVITEPMPTMPLYLWNDPDDVRYRNTYFDTYPGIWRHGDWITITEHGGVVFHGRSDATLNRHGVRLGSAEIYDIVEAVPGVRESLVIGVDQPDGTYWMPLFVVVDGELDDQMRALITERLRRDASPRHLPDDIIAVAAIPHTRTGKKLEVPIKRIFLGTDPADIVSRDAVDDPSALDAFITLAASRVMPSRRTQSDNSLSPLVLERC
jgi:acetoacetyl-CoA synthetase